MKRLWLLVDHLDYISWNVNNNYNHKSLSCHCRKWNCLMLLHCISMLYAMAPGLSRQHMSSCLSSLIIFLALPYGSINVAKFKWQCNLQFNKSLHYAIDNSLCNLIMSFKNMLFKVYFNMQSDNEILNSISKSYNKKYY